MSAGLRLAARRVIPATLRMGVESLKVHTSADLQDFRKSTAV